MSESTENKGIEQVEKIDNWVNLVTGLGNSLRDRRLSTQVDTPTALTREELENLFSGNKLAQRICARPAMDMLREWFRIDTGEDSNDVNDEFQARADELGLKTMLIEAKTFANLHGSAIVIMGIDDGLDPIQPLNMNGIKTLEWFTIMDRWSINVNRYYSDPFAAKYGEPELYEVTSPEVPGGQVIGNATIHESRVLRFDGTLTTTRRKIQNSGWSDSVFLAMYDGLRAWEHVVSASETLCTDFAQAVYKYKGLAQAISANGEDLIKARAMVIDMARSVLGAMVIDADGESFERQTTNIGGLPELWDRFMYLVCSIADMPATVLFGRSPAGENSTGESDLVTYYDRLTSERELYVAPQIERLVELLFASSDGPTNGVIPTDWRVNWLPLWQESNTELVQARKVQAETDNIYAMIGVLDADEIAQSRFGGTEYSFETTIDDNARSPINPMAEEADNGEKA